MKQPDEKIFYAVIILLSLAPVLFILSSSINEKQSLTVMWLFNYTYGVSDSQSVVFVVWLKNDAPKNYTLTFFFDDLQVGYLNVALNGLKYYEVEVQQVTRGKHVLRINAYDENSESFGSKSNPYYLLFHVDVK